MESIFITEKVEACSGLAGQPSHGSLSKRINNEKDVIHFKTMSPAFKNIQVYVDELCSLIQGTGNKIMNHKYSIKSEDYQKCSTFFDQLEKLCDNFDLSQTKSKQTLRFGHMAFRDWHDIMRDKCKTFIDDELAMHMNESLREELLVYLSESFGNKMRIDYGTGHELNFLLFTMGMIIVIEQRASSDADQSTKISDCNLTPDLIKFHVQQRGWDIHALFVYKYLRLCRNIQKKFRLEPAGSRGVYNMDDFQFLPFLFGAAQLVDVKYVSCKNFYDYEQVDMWKSDFIFFDAIDCILKNKRGPFHEHSYTLWCYSQNLGSWQNMFRKIKLKFFEEVLTPFPIIQHLLFGKFILQWE